MARISKGRRARIIERDKGICRNCGRAGAQVDHIIPRSRGGSNDDANLQLLCVRCNLRKWNHLPDGSPERVVREWCEEVFGHQLVVDQLELTKIRQLLRHLDINAEFSAALKKVG